MKCKVCGREFDLEEGFLFIRGEYVCPKCIRERRSI